MAAHLSIHNATAYVRTAMQLPDYKDYNVKGFPMGGVKYFLRYFTNNIANLHESLVLFDDRSFRSELFPDYEENLPLSSSIQLQLEYLYDILSSCNVAAYKLDTYEAYDLASAAVDQRRAKFGTPSIAVYTDRYYEAHSVTYGVELEPVSVDVNRMMLNTFSDRVVRGVRVQLNTISAYRLFTGCLSVNLGEYVTTSGIKGRELYQSFCKFVSEVQGEIYNVDLSRRVNILAKFLEQCFMDGLIDEQDIEALLIRMELTFPKSIEDLQFEPSNKNTMDLDRFARYLSICGEMPALKLLGRQYTKTNYEEIAQIDRLASQYKSGEYAVDRGLLREEFDLVSSALIELRAFE